MPTSYPASKAAPTLRARDAERSPCWRKIQALPLERIAEVEDFVEFLAAREQQRSLSAAAAASAPAFAAAWNNPTMTLTTRYDSAIHVW